jgi:hypothetical protein
MLAMEAEEKMRRETPGTWEHYINTIFYTVKQTTVTVQNHANGFTQTYYLLSDKANKS